MPCYGFSHVNRLTTRVMHSLPNILPRDPPVDNEGSSSGNQRLMCTGVTQCLPSIDNECLHVYIGKIIRQRAQFLGFRREIFGEGISR